MEHDHLHLTKHQLQHLINELSGHTEQHWLRLTLKALPLDTEKIKAIPLYSEVAWIIHKLKPYFSSWLQTWLALYFTIFLTDGYETNDFSVWVAAGGGSFTAGAGNIAVELNNPHSGTHNALATVLGPGDNASCYAPIVASPIVYNRCYYKFTSLVVPALGAISIGGIDIGIGNDWALKPEIYVFGGVPNLYLSVYENSVRTSVNSFFQPVVGTYFCLEILRDVTSSIERLWIDGVLEVDMNVAITNNSLECQVGVYGVAGAGTSATLAIDDVSLSDTYNGPLGGGATQTRLLKGVGL